VIERCEHVDGLAPVRPSSDRCESCAALGANVVELRVCLTCGHVGCCEDSPHAHALEHHLATGHPMIASLARGETWAWCYPHRRYFDPSPVPLPRRGSRLARWWRRLARRN
jgi:uncharacterized UBP type Zn finger protein